MSKPNSKSTSNVQASNNQQRKPVQTNNNANIYNAQGSRSPTRVQGASTRIAKRQLWWKEPPSEMKIPEAKPFKPVVPTSARIDNNNLGFQPAAYNNAKIETKKLKWNGQPVVDSWSNIKHQPGGLS